MQLMRPDDPRQSRVEQVGAISRGLKLLAGELNVPVLALSQLSRAPEQRPGQASRSSPTFASPATSSRTADVVCFLFREEYYERDEADEDVRGKAELILAKHRNGPIGTVELAFQSPYPRFRNMAKGYREAAPRRRAAATEPDDDPIDAADDEF